MMTEIMRIVPNEVINNFTTEINFQLVPIRALQNRTKQKLSVLLNSRKILPSEEGLFRDWRGLRYLVGLDNYYENLLLNDVDPTSKILSKWSNHEVFTSNLFLLQEFLGKIDRWDALDDTRNLFLEDAQLFLTNKQKEESFSEIHNQLDNQNYNLPIENDILTTDDLVTAKFSIPQLYYDAFLLYAEEDIKFATELIEKVEDMGFKLCIKDRDLLSVSFEHETIINLISKRCNRLIIIVSPHFLKSTANNFFVNYAQALGIEEGKNKIIPVIFMQCAIPTQLRFYFLLYYQRSNNLYNFWDKLKQSLDKGSLELMRRKVLSQNDEIERRQILIRENHAFKIKEKAVIEEINSSVQIINSNNHNNQTNKQIELKKETDSIEKPKKIKSTSMWNLHLTEKKTDKNNELTKSNTNINKIETTNKKPKWLNKLLSSKSTTKTTEELSDKKKTKTNKNKLFQRKKMIAD